MARLSAHHEELTDGVGKCSVPMWSGYGDEAGFCDEPAYGKQVVTKCYLGCPPDGARGGSYGPGWVGGRWYPGAVWSPSYCSGLACPNHGGPQKPAPDAGERKSDG